MYCPAPFCPLEKGIMRNMWCQWYFRLQHHRSQEYPHHWDYGLSLYREPELVCSCLPSNRGLRRRNKGARRVEHSNWPVPLTRRCCHLMMKIMLWLQAPDRVGSIPIRKNRRWDNWTSQPIRIKLILGRVLPLENQPTLHRTCGLLNWGPRVINWDLRLGIRLRLS